MSLEVDRYLGQGLVVFGGLGVVLSDRLMLLVPVVRVNKDAGGDLIFQTVDGQPEVQGDQTCFVDLFDLSVNEQGIILLDVHTW
jgi:hypothetical protein